MVRMFYIGCEFLYTAAAAWFMLTLAGAIWKPVLGKWAATMIEVAAMIVVAGVTAYHSSIATVSFSNAILMMNILLVSLAVTIVCHCKYRDVFCLIYLFWSALTLADFFLQTLIYTIREDMELAPEIFLVASVPRGIYLLLWAVFLCVAAYYVYRLGKERWAEAAVYLKKAWFLFPLLFVCMVYFQRIYKQLVSGMLLYSWRLFWLGGILLVPFAFICYVVHREKERYRLLWQKSEMLEYDYMAMKVAYREKEILLHDIGKHMLTIREMAEADQAQEIVRYLDEMDGVLRKGRNRDLVNHDLLNLILNRKFQEAEEAGISVWYELDDMEKLVLKSMEICALFANILDNSIEANQALTKETGRWIKLTCTRKKKMLVISCSNPVLKGKIRFVGGVPQTTKKDSGNHGLGMRSIQQVVDSYGGHMQIEVKDDIFGLKIYLEGFA